MSEQPGDERPAAAPGTPESGGWRPPPHAELYPLPPRSGPPPAVGQGQSSAGATPESQSEPGVVPEGWPPADAQDTLRLPPAPESPAPSLPVHPAFETGPHPLRDDQPPADQEITQQLPTVPPPTDPTATAVLPEIGPPTGAPPGPVVGPSHYAAGGEPAQPADRAAAPPTGHTARSRRAAKATGRKRRRAPWWELPLLVLIAAIVAVLVKTFLIQPFYIPSASMEKTLHGCTGCSGDRILVNKVIYDFRDPHPGDIVVFHAHQGWNDEQASKPPSNPVLRAVRGLGQLVGFVPPDGLIIVKRVIAVGGQTVRGLRVDAEGQPCAATATGSTDTCHDEVQISTHGTAGPWRTLHEPYVYGGNDDISAGTFGPVTVPKGRLWVMGDHRDDSEDSRYHCTASPGPPTGGPCDPMQSTIATSWVIGKAAMIIWPPSRWRTLGTPSTFTQSAAAVGTGSVPLLGSAILVVPFALRRRRRRRLPPPRASGAPPPPRVTRAAPPPRASRAAPPPRASGAARPVSRRTRSGAVPPRWRGLLRPRRWVRRRAK